MPLFNANAVAGLLGPNTFADSTGLGPDFPSSAGDRERGKFRPSSYPRLTAVAVTNDDGSDMARNTFQLLEAILYELRTLRHAMVLEGFAADLDGPIDS